MLAFFIHHSSFLLHPFFHPPFFPDGGLVGHQRVLGTALRRARSRRAADAEVRDDDAAAFEELMLRYQNRLVTVLEHLVGDRTQAEDLAQEVFLRVYRARKTLCARLEVFDLAVHDRQQRGHATRCVRGRGGAR